MQARGGKPRRQVQESLHSPAPFLTDWKALTTGSLPWGDRHSCGQAG
ncbi:MAG: hypothetical protein HC890_19645 [Chloroflexaceae bacterium]|nr:hypothetical protein [Chloroflexaceae bacterium]